MNRFCRASGRLLSVVCLVLLQSSLVAQSEPAKKIHSLEGFTEYRLPNGLKILFYPDASSSRVTVNMTVLVGSRHEGYGEAGMAHLLEHMLFKGTPTFPDVPKALRDHGADFNGTTSLDRTNYFQTMPASDKNLEFALKLEADRLVNSYVKREDLVSEMTVVRNEFESGENNPVGILFQRMMGASYEWHNYGKSTIGNRSDIERVPIERLQEFYRRFYQPDNVVLIVAGQFDDQKTLGWIGKYFGAIPKPKRQLDRTYTEEPAQDGEREVILRRVGKVAAVGAVYHVPAASHPDFAALEVLAEILDYEPEGLLYKALVASKKAAGVQCFSFALHDPGLFISMAQVEADDEKAVRDTLNVLIENLERDNSKAFTKEEVERSKKKLMSARVQQMQNVNRIGVALSDWVARGDWRLFLLHRDRTEKVTPEDVARVAKKYLQRSNRTAGLYLPTKTTQRTPVPETPNVADLVKDYKGREAVKAGEVLDPDPMKIEARTKRSTLDSGIKAALLPKKTRGEAVNVQMTLRFGNEESLKGKSTAAEFLGAMMQRGTKTMNRREIDDELARLEATVTLNSGPGELSVGIVCKRETLPAVLKVVRGMLREPSFPEDEFDVLKRQYLKTLEQQTTEPTALAQRAMRKVLGPTDKDDIHYAPSVEEEIERLKKTTLDQIKQLHREQVGGTHGELSAVGDFDAEALVKQIDGVLDGWKSEVPYRRVVRKAYPDRKPETSSINTPDKANAMWLAALSVSMKDSDPYYPALQMANYLFGGAPLASRLSQRVRGKEGLSYSVGSQFNARALDDYGAFYLFAICKPDNLDKVDKAVKDEIARFWKDGVTEKELSEGIKAYLENLKNGRSSDASLAGMLNSLLASGRTMEFVAQREKAIAGLTTDKVNEAVRKTIDPKQLNFIRAGDLGKKP